MLPNFYSLCTNVVTPSVWLLDPGAPWLIPRVFRALLLAT